MKNSRRLFPLFLVLILLLSWGSVHAQETSTLTVFAAASLTDAFIELDAAYESANLGVTVNFNFGSSSTLATQLVEGAPADVFASANSRQMTVAQEGGRIAGKPRIFVKNRLVVVVPVDNPANITTLRDLAKSGVKLIIAAPDVPVREYTDTMLNRLVSDSTYGENYRTAFVANVVSEEDNVRQVSAKVALGEADAGIVYLSDITPDIADQVTILPIPDALNTIATYPIAITHDSPNPELAQAFVDFVLSDAGQDILVKWGFISIRIPDLPATINPVNDGALRVNGQVLNPLVLRVDDLRNDYSSHTIEVTYQNGEATVTTTFTGVLLWDILSGAQVNFNADILNDKLSLFVVATSADGYQAVISWGEIDPEFGNQPVLVAYEYNSQPIAEGSIQLVVPGDKHDGRYVRRLVDLSLRDAPSVAE